MFRSEASTHQLSRSKRAILDHNLFLRHLGITIAISLAGLTLAVAFVIGLLFDLSLVTSLLLGASITVRCLLNTDCNVISIDPGNLDLIKVEEG
jgi:ABC-type phosphate/phosphonate transport system permease subunit